MSNSIVRRHFSAQTVSALTRRGIQVVGVQAARAFEGDVYFSGKSYTLLDNGTERVRSFAQVLEIAQGGAI